jgi:hypothetical protein
MSKSPPAGRDEEAEARDRAARQLAAAVCQAVLNGLGRPADLLNVTARQVAGHNYRVNVVTGADPTCALIAHSFFVAVDDHGNVLDSTPPLARRY